VKPIVSRLETPVITTLEELILFLKAVELHESRIAVPAEELVYPLLLFRTKTVRPVEIAIICGFSA
jgi:hypothetical protein